MRDQDFTRTPPPKPSNKALMVLSSYLQGKPGNQDTVMITLPFVS